MSAASPGASRTGGSALDRLAHPGDQGGGERAGGAIGNQGQDVAHGRRCGPWPRAESMAEPPHALIVAGPTASGKSALALALAQRLGGSVINADAMQLYRELRVLTARPSPAEEAMAPHASLWRACGGRAGERRLVAGGRAARRWRWRGPRGACRSCAAARSSISPGWSRAWRRSPSPAAAARAEARRLLAEIGPAALHAALAKVDPATAARLRPSDSQRVARAWEVWRGTGRGLAAWQAERGTPAPWRFSAILLDPPRDTLREAIAARFAAMLRRGGAGGGAHPVGTRPRPRPAGAARAWRAGAWRASARGDHARRGRAPGGAGDRAIHEAAGDLAAPPAAHGPRAHAYDPCALHGSSAIFGMRDCLFDEFSSRRRLTHCNVPSKQPP